MGKLLDLIDLTDSWELLSPIPGTPKSLLRTAQLAQGCCRGNTSKNGPFTNCLKISIFKVTLGGAEEKQKNHISTYKLP